VKQIQLPTPDYESLIEAFKKDRYCYIYEGDLTLCECESEDDQSYPEIKIKISDETELALK